MKIVIRPYSIPSLLLCTGNHGMNIVCCVLTICRVMIKRAQGRKRFGRKNFKQRYFRLTTEDLTYSRNKGMCFNVTELCYN